jgi:hypothetical protein
MVDDDGMQSIRLSTPVFDIVCLFREDWDMISGYKFIRHLGKQGLRGQLFSYEQYKTIGKISKFVELRAFVKECGFKSTEQAKNEIELVEVIKGQGEGKWAALHTLEVLLWVTLSLGSCS